MAASGPSKAGKSFLQIELCIAIAEGKKWLQWNCAQGRVMYVNLELDRASCLHRFKDGHSLLQCFDQPCLFLASASACSPFKCCFPLFTYIVFFPHFLELFCSQNEYGTSTSIPPTASTSDTTPLKLIFA